MDQVAHILAYPPLAGSHCLQSSGGSLHCSRAPALPQLTSFRSQVEDDSQRALLTAPPFPGVSTVLGAFVEGEQQLVLSSSSRG